MPQIIPIDAVIRLTLCKLYELTALQGKFKVDVSDIASAIGNEVSVGFVVLALNNLSEQGYVNSFVENKDELRANLTPKGAREAEQDLKNPESLPYKFQRLGEQAFRDQIVEAGGVPAADRFVDRNHNSTVFDALVENLTELEKSLKSGNEAGVIFGEDREAIAEEVGVLRSLIISSKVRISVALEFARRTLGWIAEKAGAAAVAELAKKALAFAITWLAS